MLEIYLLKNKKIESGEDKSKLKIESWVSFNIYE